MDDDLLNNMGDAALGTVTAHLYSAAHPSAMNKEFVAAYKKAFNSRPGFMAVSGYDGIHLIYEALKKTGGKTDGDGLIEAMKGMKWESPRGRFRSIRKPATSCRTSTSARSRRSTANSTTSNLRPSRPSRTPARPRSDIHAWGLPLTQLAKSELRSSLSRKSEARERLRLAPKAEVVDFHLAPLAGRGRIAEQSG